MDTVFPVEFEVGRPAGDKSPSSLLQGFTRNVSAGGMCLEVKSFGARTEQLFVQGSTVDLTINTTFQKRPIRAAGRIVWVQRIDDVLPVRYLIGIAYSNIDEKARQRIFKHARRLLWVPRIAVLLGLVLTALLAFSVAQSQKLAAENRRLVGALVENAEKKSTVASHLQELEAKKKDLERELAAAQGSIHNLETSVASLSAQDLKGRAGYEKELAAARQKEDALSRTLAAVSAGREKLEATYRDLAAGVAADRSLVMGQMHAWLVSHRNLRTGLVASFEGDPKLEDWAFSYDQSLACQVFTLFGDTAYAESILTFFQERAERLDGAYFNAYDTFDGSPKERLVRAGPNIWLGLAALQFEHRVKNGRFLPMARQVGDWVLGQEDAEGGVKGGPDVTWISTEHNLDAYAFLALLYEETGDAKYRDGRDRSLAWIQKYAYSEKEKRMRRGKGDSAIATDTFSWAIAAIGPATLKKISFDPVEILDFAEKNCQVTVVFNQPNGKPVKASGFDFAKAQNVGRGGIISTEWTAQMIVTYEEMADYFSSSADTASAERYRQKAQFYLNELQKLIITSPSRTGQGRGCLPYASTDNADTGHGWRTPAGRRTGSVAGTAYGLFAWRGYNPFSFRTPAAENDAA